MTIIKIAVVQALDGHLSCSGPNDFSASEYDDAMSAAIGWHLEGGNLPAATYWVEVDIPPVPDIQHLRGLADAGAFPKSLIAEMDGA